MNYFCEKCKALIPSEDAVELGELSFRSLLLGGAIASCWVWQANNKHIVCKRCIKKVQKKGK